MIYIGADHRGFELKAKISKWLAGRKYEFEDVGAYELNLDDDYTDFAISVGMAVSDSPGRRRGVVICGSGVGAEVAANKVRGVRCGLGFEPDQVCAARKDDDINVLALASDNTSTERAMKLVEAFLETPFVTSEKHRQRVEKIERYERITAGFGAAGY